MFFDFCYWFLILKLLRDVWKNQEGKRIAFIWSIGFDRITNFFNQNTTFFENMWQIMEAICDINL